jgi:hypothetical protein
LQTNNACFIDDQANEKKFLDEFFNKDLLYESDNNNNNINLSNVTSIDDKIGFQIYQLENSIKNDYDLPYQIQDISSNLVDENDLDFHTLNQIMNECIHNLWDEKEIEDIDGSSSQKSFTDNSFVNDFDIESNVLVQRIDPMISNGLFDIKLF